MKQKIKGRLYRCGNLKDHCLCPLFNCCIWSFEGSLSSPSLCQVPAWLRPPQGQGTCGDRNLKLLCWWPFLGNVWLPSLEQACWVRAVCERLGELFRGEALSQAWVWPCLGMTSSSCEFSMCKEQVGYNKYGDMWDWQANLSGQKQHENLWSA